MKFMTKKSTKMIVMITLLVLMLSGFVAPVFATGGEIELTNENPEALQEVAEHSRRQLIAIGSVAVLFVLSIAAAFYFSFKEKPKKK